MNIEQPGANVFVTPMAAVPLRVVAKDDLAVHDVRLHISRSGAGETPDSVLPLFAGPPRAEPSATGLVGGAGARREQSITSGKSQLWISSPAIKSLSTLRPSTICPKLDAAPIGG